MKTQFENFFYYTKAERRGALVLLGCCCLWLFVPYLQKLFLKEQKVDFSAFEEAICIIEQQREGISIGDHSAVGKDTFPLFDFDPNTAGKDTLLALGLPAKTVYTLINYREKGGRFRKVEDLKKLYTLSDKDFKRIEPFVSIKSNKKRLVTYPAALSAPKSVFAIDVNKASEEEWQKLYGIGPYYAKRIVRFREKLGGFASVGQVALTYHLPDSTFQKIRPKLRHSPIYRPLQINLLTAEEMAEHPYLNTRQAAAIFNYRAAHGPFKNLQQLQQSMEAINIDWEKLKPYLDFSIS